MEHQLARPIASRKPFDPTYDPIRAPNPGEGKDYAPTYWIGTAGKPPSDDGPVTCDMDVDVAIVGSGYTGLSCAIHLAREHGIKATVLEANGVAWGCSTRNGGQAQISAGRLKRSQWIERWGVDIAKKLHVEISEAFDLFRDLIRSPEIDCDAQDGGHLYIAHRDKVMPALESESRLLNEVFGYRSRIVGREEVHRDFVRDEEAKGGYVRTGRDGDPRSQARLRIPQSGAQARCAGPYGEPRSQLRLEKRLLSPVYAGRHRSCTRRLHCDGGLYLAGSP